MSVKHLLSRRSIILFLLACWCVALSGCVRTRLQSITYARHAVLVSRLSADEAVLIGQEADNIVQGICRYMKLPAPDRPTVIMLADSTEAMRLYLQKHAPHMSDAGGAYISLPEGPVVVVARRGERAETMRYMRHELTHHVLGSHYAKTPPWINEGLAQFFENGPPYGRAHPVVLPRLIKAMAQEGRGLLGRLVALPEGVRLNRADGDAAWGLVHYLMTHRKHGVAAIKKYMHGIGAGADAQGLFKQVFDSVPEALEGTWRQYIRGLGSQKHLQGQCLPLLHYAPIAAHQQESLEKIQRKA